MATYLCLFLVVFVVSGSLAAIPGELKPCKQSSPDYGKCLDSEIEKAMHFFKGGNKKLGVNPLDPFKFEKLMVDQGTGPVAIKLEFKNTEIRGLTDAKIFDAKNDWKTISFKGKVDSLQIIGDYTISGKVLVLPISGSGKSNITMLDAEAKVSIKLKEIDNKGKPYVQAESIECTITPKKTIFNFLNLFNGDKALGDNMNTFLNENHEQIITELNPAISRGLSQGFGEIINQILSKIPLKEVKV
ncbi:unnamed protein product [Nezara viridula]|uniref:Uncharacterized protein n=1 Tax=Nezara viridula TaxID=85310 RepID=A0A9P0MKY5_NEZVI|nr:unnamed protein product [Nezara viridula]